MSVLRRLLPRTHVLSFGTVRSSLKKLSCTGAEQLFQVVQVNGDLLKREISSLLVWACVPKGEVLHLGPTVLVVKSGSEKTHVESHATVTTAAASLGLVVAASQSS